MINFIVGYFKWAINVVIKSFFLAIVALLILSIATITLNVDINAIFLTTPNGEILGNALQSLPHIGALASDILNLIGAAKTETYAIEATIYSEVLICCIYMIIVRLFESTIQLFTNIFKRFMSMGKITTILTDVTVLLLSCTLALGMACLISDGIVRIIPANVVCWIMAGAVILISIIILIIRKKSMLAAFLNLVGGGVLDILNLVLIYSAMMCISILNSTLGATYLSASEQITLIAFVFISAVIFAVLLIKRALNEAK